MDFLLLDLLAQRGRFFGKLWEGDPLAWVCLAFGMAAAFGGPLLKARWAKSKEEKGAASADDEGESSQG